MHSPIKTLEHFQRFCSLNNEFQDIEWLRYAVKTSTPEGHFWSVKQNEHRIELHVEKHEAVLLLWIKNALPPPMDDIKPQWDTSPMVQRALARSEDFPQAVAWAPHLENADWSCIWIGTQWWPIEDITDAVDAPNQWLHWWWTDMMEFTTEPPNLYDTAVA